MRLDPFKDIFQPLLFITAVFLAGSHKGIHGSCHLGCLVGAGEQKCFSLLEVNIGKNFPTLSESESLPSSTRLMITAAESSMAYDWMIFDGGDHRQVSY